MVCTTPFMETQMELETQHLADLTWTDNSWNALNAFLEMCAPVYNWH